METDQESEHASAQRKLMQVCQTTFFICHIINQKFFEIMKHLIGEVQ